MVDTSGTWTIITTSAWNSAQSQFQIYQIAAELMVFVIIGIIVLFKDAIPFIWARFVTHDVVVVNFDSSGRKIYKNTTDVTDVGGSFTGLPNNNARPFYIGWDDPRGIGETNLLAILDNVCIFNKALSTDEIAFLYNGGTGTESLTDQTDSGTGVTMDDLFSEEWNW